MPIIQVPQLLALDTAILAVWAHRWRRGDVRAHRLVDAVLRSNARPVITLHHLIELSGHESDDVVQSRARFFRNLQQLFWVKARNGAAIGGILDLYALEIRARLDDRKASFPELLSRVRSDAIAFGDSREVSALMEERIFVADSRERIRRRRTVASISLTQVSMPEITRRLVDPEQRQVPLATVLANIERERQHLESQLRMVGDPDLEESDSIAKQFFDELRERATAATMNGNVNLAHALDSSGLKMSISMRRSPQNCSLTSTFGSKGVESSLALRVSHKMPSRSLMRQICHPPVSVRISPSLERDLHGPKVVTSMMHR